MKLAPLRSGPLARPGVQLAIAAALAAVAALAGGELAGGALRALALVALLGLAATALRSRGSASTPPGALLLVEERHFLAKESGVAVVAASGRRLVVGFGPHGVRLLAEIGAGEVRP